MYDVSEKYTSLIKSPVRYTGIRGAIRLKDGSTISINDDDIAAGSLSITHKMNGRGDLRPGGVYSGELSVTLKDFHGTTGDLDGAVIKLTFVLFHDSSMLLSESEMIPLGSYYVDGSSIKRRSKEVSFSAYDGMAVFDIAATERTGKLYELVTGACDAAGIEIGMSEPEFEALPNGGRTATVNTARIQTERDLLMYVGMMTASFARISRGYKLEFVPLTCIRTPGGVITPVREIAGNIRYNTEFSDDVTCIAKLFTRRNGKAVFSTMNITAGGSEKLTGLELNENPLLAELDDSDVVSVLNSELSELYQCLNRVYDSDFNGDPALDVGDYVRLSGGAIDTSRGYATGMITSQTWRYRGQHTIKCTMPSSLTAVSSIDLQSSAVAVYSDTGMPGNQRVQPKPQLEKRVDALEASSGCDGKLHDVNKSKAVGYLSKNTDDDITTIQIDGDDGKEDMAIRCSQKLSYMGMTLMGSDGVQDGTIEVYAGEINLSSGGNHIYIGHSPGGSIEISSGSARIIVYGSASSSSSGSFGIQAGNSMVTFENGSLYINGKKVLTE
jgi:hypothetical protein